MNEFINIITSPIVHTATNLLVGALVGGLIAWLKAKNRQLDASGRMLRGIGHDRIIWLGSSYIQRGSITKDEYENLHDYLWQPYRDLGGNGTAERVMKEIEKLPLTKMEGGRSLY